MFMFFDKKKEKKFERLLGMYLGRCRFVMPDGVSYARYVIS